MSGNLQVCMAAAVFNFPVQRDRKIGLGGLTFLPLQCSVDKCSSVQFSAVLCCAVQCSILATGLDCPWPPYARVGEAGGEGGGGRVSPNGSHSTALWTAPGGRCSTLILKLHYALASYALFSIRVYALCPMSLPKVVVLTPVRVPLHQSPVYFLWQVGRPLLLCRVWSLGRSVQPIEPAQR